MAIAAGLLLAIGLLAFVRLAAICRAKARQDGGAPTRVSCAPEAAPNVARAQRALSLLIALVPHVELAKGKLCLLAKTVALRACDAVQVASRLVVSAAAQAQSAKETVANLTRTAYAGIQVKVNCSLAALVPDDEQLDQGPSKWEDCDVTSEPRSASRGATVKAGPRTTSRNIEPEDDDDAQPPMRMIPRRGRSQVADDDREEDQEYSAPRSIKKHQSAPRSIKKHQTAGSRRGLPRESNGLVADEESLSELVKSIDADGPLHASLEGLDALTSRLRSQSDWRRAHRGQQRGKNPQAATCAGEPDQEEMILHPPRLGRNGSANAMQMLGGDLD